MSLNKDGSSLKIVFYIIKNDHINKIIFGTLKSDLNFQSNFVI